MTETFPTPQPLGTVRVSDNGEVGYTGSDYEGPEPPPFSNIGAGTETITPTDTVPTDQAGGGKKRRMGEGRKRGSGVRQLTKKDLEQLLSYYGQLSVIVGMFRSKTGEMIAVQSQECVDRWAELAQQNDSVRRALIAMLETSAWGAVLVAHMPIFLSLVPEDALQWLPGLFGGLPKDGDDINENDAYRSRGES